MAWSRERHIVRPNAPVRTPGIWNASRDSVELAEPVVETLLVATPAFDLTACEAPDEVFAETGRCGPVVDRTCYISIVQ